MLKHTKNKQSKSTVILMCGPAGSGKSSWAKKFEKSGMILLSFDEESFKLGYTAHPLPQEIHYKIKAKLDEKLLFLIKEEKDVVLDYSFWSKEMRREYLLLMRGYGIEPIIYYIQTPKEIVMERIRKRKGDNPNAIILSEKTASVYYDNFQPPTSAEGNVIQVKGY